MYKVNNMKLFLTNEIYSINTMFQEPGHHFQLLSTTFQNQKFCCKNNN